MSAAWATALREAPYFGMGRNPGLGGRLFRTQFACGHLVRTTRRLQKHRVIPSVAALDARRRPVRNLRLEAFERFVFVMSVLAPFSGAARSRTSGRQEGERYCMPLSLPGNVPRSGQGLIPGRGLIPKITKKRAARETQMEPQFLVSTRTREAHSL